MAEDLQIKFGYPGNSFAYQGTGWSIREPDGVWMLDGESTLIVPRPKQPGDYLMEFDLEGLLAPGREFQRLSVRVNGVCVANQVVRGRALVQCWVPWSVLGGPMKSVVILSHPDAWSPAEGRDEGDGDPRVLSLYARTIRMSLLTERAWVADHLRPEDEAELEAIIARQQSQDGQTMHALVLEFESLGSNCELGMVQRNHHAEPLGLFRFSYTPLDGLIAALEGDYRTASFADSTSLVLNPETREYELVDRVHGFEWHTWKYEGQVDPEALAGQELVRLPYLVRRFYETLEDGEKILVLRDDQSPTDPARIARLLAALRRHGDITLLWIGVAGDAHAVGDVEWAGDNLMRGWIDRLTRRYNAVDASMAAWGVICQRAHRLRETAGAARQAA